MPLSLDGTLGAVFPTWTTATRPASPSISQTGYNTTTNCLDVYNGSSWTSVSVPTSQGTSGQFLKSNGAGTAPSWAAAGVSWQAVKTGNFTAVSNEGYFVNTTSGAITVTLPASPAVGDTITFVDYAGTWATNNVTLSPNGRNIQGTTANAVLNTKRQAESLVYADATQGWVSYSDNASAIPQPYTVTWLVVAGGGGGGSVAAAWEAAGGGGAGGVGEGTASITPGTVMTVTVGGGGGAGTTGTNSSIVIGAVTETAYGGGAGANNSGTGAAGGSGGGGSGTGGTGTPGGASNKGAGTYTTFYGNTGGQGQSGGPRFGGGGGGAGNAGQTGGPGASAGGNGRANSITGTSVTYGGGGGGAAGAPGGGTGGTGGTGGGGAGGNSNNSSANGGVAGTANTGGGGGGAGGFQTGGPFVSGSAGGSGVVVLSIPTANYTGTTTGSPTVTTSGSNTILRFTSSGTYTA